MSNKNNVQHILNLNLSMLAMSTSGVLGRYIDLPVPITIALRSVLAGLFLFLFCRWKGFSFRIQKKDISVLLLSGLLMGLHWITYFYSLKLSNVAIGMLSIFTYPVITSFLEPLILKTRFRKVQILLGIMVLLGIYLLVPELNFQNKYFIAVLLGILSAILYSLRNILVRSKSSEYNGSVIMMYQLMVISVFLSPFFVLGESSGISSQFPYVLLLSLLTTAIGHTMFVYSLKHFSASSASIMSSVQPIYGIILGMLFLKEIPGMNALIGGVIILLSVVMENISSMKDRSTGLKLR